MTATDPVHADRPSLEDTHTAARWMVQRHPVLARLLARVPGFLDADGDPDVDLLAETITEYEQYVSAWTVYRERFPAPKDEVRFEAWQEAGPRTSGTVAAISCMSSSERARLRMLATFSSERVPVSVLDFSSLDADGRALLTDWTIAVRAS